MRSLMLYKYPLFVILFFFVASSIAFGQSQPLTELQSSYKKFAENNLPEKIYMHTDRTFYFCGDVLWFKAYLADAENNQPLGVSKVVYVELINKSDQPVMQGKISMNNGFGSGSFYIPFSVPSGNYTLRAYTNWMKNSSPDYFFRKNISIYNSSAKPVPASAKPSVNYTMDLFPEGGNLVSGIESKIAFKVNDNNIKGVDCEGVVVDQMKDTVATFKSLQFGMGYFLLKPESGKQYTAIVNFKDGSSIKKNLPEAHRSGYVMRVTDGDAANVKIAVEAAGDYSSRNIFIVVQNNNQIEYAKSMTFENNKVALTIDKADLKDGVSQITVFDENKQPLCERLYFKRPGKKLLINTKSDRSAYDTRSNVIVNVHTGSAANTPLAGNLSAAVYRVDNLNQPTHENIFSYLWLSSNVHGSVENADYYFSANNSETNQALDNLLLSQGWRKFDWKNISQNKTPSFNYVPELAGHIVTGRVTNESTREGVAGVQVYLSVPGKRIQLKGCLSDKDGFVHFDMKDFFGPSQIIMQTNDNIIHHLEIFSSFSEKFSKNILQPLNVDPNYSEDMRLGNMHMEVQNVYHQNKFDQFADPHADTIPFYGKPYKTYLLADYTRFTTMEEVMREYVAEVNVRKTGSKYRFNTFNSDGFDLKNLQTIEQVFQTNPLVLLDGVPVFNINKIIEYDPLKVAKLEVVANRYQYGTITAEGILSYTSIKGTLEDFTLDPNDLVLDYEGLQQQRIFYSPKYETAADRASRLPDFRDVLYWTPDLKTSSQGDGSFTFFTGDVPGKYVVVIEGLANDGSAGSDSFIFNVSK
jgi:hypothetical protein